VHTNIDSPSNKNKCNTIKATYHRTPLYHECKRLKYVASQAIIDFKRALRFRRRELSGCTERFQIKKVIEVFLSWNERVCRPRRMVMSWCLCLF
jgi:hypothetical protein